MSDEESNPESLTSRFSELWGETATLVTVFASIIRTSEKAMFNDRYREDLEHIGSIVAEGLEFLDKLEEKPKPKFGFTKEDPEDGS